MFTNVHAGEHRGCGFLPRGSWLAVSRQLAEAEGKRVRPACASCAPDAGEPPSKNVQICPPVPGCPTMRQRVTSNPSSAIPGAEPYLATPPPASPEDLPNVILLAAS